jgi:hypothetical protein
MKRGAVYNSTQHAVAVITIVPTVSISELASLTTTITHSKSDSVSKIMNSGAVKCLLGQSSSYHILLAQLTHYTPASADTLLVLLQRCP